LLSLSIGSGGGTLEADKPESGVYNPSAPSFHTETDTLLKPSLLVTNVGGKDTENYAKPAIFRDDT